MGVTGLNSIAVAGAMLVLGRSVGLYRVMKVEYSDGMLVACRTRTFCSLEKS